MPHLTAKYVRSWTQSRIFTRLKSNQMKILSLQCDLVYPGIDHPGGDPRDAQAHPERVLLVAGGGHGLLRAVVQQQTSGREQIRQHIRVWLCGGEF